MIDLAQPGSLLALLALPAIVALYSLRPSRRRVLLASTALWREALAERRRGLGLERLLRNLSLLLLLLFALLAALALAEPRWLSSGADRGDIVLVLDTSASMQAEESGGRRFEMARREAAALIDELPAASRMLLMSSGRRALLHSAFEDDKRLLHEQLSMLRAGDEAGRPREALTLALSLLRNRERGRVVFLTDGAFDESLDFGGVDVEYRLFGKAVDNLAITRFDARREPGSAERFQVLVTLGSHSRETQSAPLSVSLDGQTLVEEVVELAPGESVTRVWAFRGRASGRARALLDTGDALAADDRAYAVLGADEPLRLLLLGPGNHYLESALAALPGVLLKRLASLPADYLAEEFARHDVVVVDGLQMPELPPGAYLLVDSVPPGLPFMATGRVSRPAVTGRGRSALLENLDLTALRIEEAARIVVAEEGVALQPLFWSSETPLALSAIAGERRIVYLGFDPARSTLPLQAAFPLFVRQSVEWLRPRMREDSPTQLVAGEAATLRLPPGRFDVIVRGPDNEAAVYATVGTSLVYDATARAGIYQYSFGYEDGAVQRYFAVNLADERESDLRPRLQQGDGSEAEAFFDARAQVHRPLWPWLALLALLALLAEFCLPMRWRRRG